MVAWPADEAPTSAAVPHIGSKAAATTFAVAGVVAAAVVVDVALVGALVVAAVVPGPAAVANPVVAGFAVAASFAILLVAPMLAPSKRFLVALMMAQDT